MCYYDIVAFYISRVSHTSMEKDKAGRREIHTMTGKPAAPGSQEAARLRRNETRDIARRLPPIPPRSLRIAELAGHRPVAAFNPALLVDTRSGKAKIYPRVLAGYYTYTSAIAEVEVELARLLEQRPLGEVEARLAVTPGNWYDFWGAEDPRVYTIGGRVYMTYTGRTKNFFTGEEPLTLPVTAVYSDGSWRPIHVYAPRPPPRMDKDAFAAEAGGRVVHMHRPEYGLELYMAVALDAEEKQGRDGLAELVPRREYSIDIQAGFEERVGWSAPPVTIGGRTVFLLHGVSGGVYRVFAAEISLSGGAPRVEAVTPGYIMEPRLPYEVYGDRPHTVFPCGAALVDDDILVAYGAGDMFTGLALISVDELLSELDRGRVG